MAAPDGAPADRIEEDSLYARGLGLNVTAQWGYDDLADPDPGDPGLETRRRRLARAARSLLWRIDADPERLAAVAEAVAAQARPDGEGRRRRGAYNAVIIADVALGMLREAGAANDPAARARLLAEIREARYGPAEEEPSTPGVFDAHRLPRRVLRRVSPLWWLRRLDARANVRLVPQDHDPDPDALREILMLRGGYEVGSLKYLLCDECQLGCVAKIEVDEDYQGRGLGTRALELVRAQAPGYQWCTTSQDDTAVTFWQRIARRTGDAYTDDDGDLKPCPHMN